MDFPTLEQFNALTPRERFKVAHLLERLYRQDIVEVSKAVEVLQYGMITPDVWVKNVINGKFRPIYGYNNGYKLRLGLVVAGIRPLKDDKILGYPINVYFNKYVY